MNRHLLAGLCLVLSAVSAEAQQVRLDEDLFNILRHDDAAGLRSRIAEGFDVNRQYVPAERTLLMLAILEDRTRIAKLLLQEGANTDLQDRQGFTALHLASRRGVGFVRLLLESGRKPRLELQTKEGLTAAELAALYGRREGLDRLVAAGARFTADLVFLSGVGDLEGMKALVAAGAGVNTTNKAQLTPLAAAALAGQLKSVEYLLAQGALPDAPSRHTPLNLAVGWHHPAIAAALLEAGAMPDRQDAEGLYPLANASSVGDVVLVRLLLAKGARPTGVGTNYHPMHEAASSDNPAVLKELLDHGADINARMLADGPTPLIAAAADGKARAVAYLLSRGAQVGARAKFWRGDPRNNEAEFLTALQVARANHQDAVLRAFEDPESFAVTESLDFTKPGGIALKDWVRRYAEFDPRNGRTSTVTSFKDVFGEPGRILEVGLESFWYYHCADGVVELKLINPKNTGGQLVVQDFSTAARGDAGSPAARSTGVNKEAAGAGSSQPGAGTRPMATVAESIPKAPQTPPSVASTPAVTTAPASAAAAAKPAVSPVTGMASTNSVTTGEESGAPRSNREQALLRMLELLTQTRPSGAAGVRRPELNHLLCDAARQGFPGATARCLEQGAELNGVDALGNTALMLAAQNGHVQVVSLLLSKGADARKSNRRGKTALDLTRDDAVREALTKPASVR